MTSNAAPAPAPHPHIPVDEDDVTVVTGKSTSRPSADNKIWKEMVVKLRFQSSDDLRTKDISHLSFAVINAMKQSFQNSVRITTNANKELRTVQAPTNEADFTKLFHVTHSRGNKAKRIKCQSWIIFRIGTDMTLANIRKDTEVQAALRRTNGNLVYYPWMEDVREVVSLGFFVGPLPKYMTSSQFEEELISTISAKAKIDTKRIPKHRCIMETITAVSPGTAIRYKCQAFVIQTEKQNAPKLRKFLYAAFANQDESLIFISFEQRRLDSLTFVKAVHRQAECEAQHRIIAIKGIHPDTMFQFDVDLQKAHPKILKVFRTPTTNYLNCGGEPLGRYNLLCKSTEFVSLARTLHTTLAEMYTASIGKTNFTIPEPLHAEPVCVISRFPTGSNPGSDTSLSSRNTFFTSSHSILTNQELQQATVPQGSWTAIPGPKPPIPTVIHTPSPSLHAPPTMQKQPPETSPASTYAAVAADNAQVRRSNPTDPYQTIAGLTEQLRNMTAIIAAQEQRILEQTAEQKAYREATDARLLEMMAILQEKLHPHPVLPPSQSSYSPMRKQRRTESTVTPRQGDGMSDTDMTSDDQDHES